MTSNSPNTPPSPRTTQPHIKTSSLGFELPEMLKRRLLSKLSLEGLTVKAWAIEMIEQYVATSANKDE